MKAVDFDYERPPTIAAAIGLLAGPAGGNAKIMAGGQTLGPMLNLRFVQPELVIDIRRIPELSRVEEAPGHITYGACTAHAAFEDGRVPDGTGGMLTRVAHGIAYRAVRTRGTIGGSLAHADPAADWLSSLIALGASVSIVGPHGRRVEPIDRFALGVMETTLGPDEIIDGVVVSRLSATARWGYSKICRKTGEFADAIGAVVIDRDRCRIVAGATGGAPILIDGAAGGILAGKAATLERLTGVLAGHFGGDHYETKVHVACVRRALDEAMS